MTKPRITLFKQTLADSLTHTHTHTHTHAHTHTHTHTHIHMHTQAHVSTRTHTHIDIVKEAYHFHLLVSMPEWKEQNKVHVSACATDQQNPQQNKKQCKNITLSVCMCNNLWGHSKTNCMSVKKNIYINKSAKNTCKSTKWEGGGGGGGGRLAAKYWVITGQDLIIHIHRNRDRDRDRQNWISFQS